MTARRATIAGLAIALSGCVHTSPPPERDLTTLTPAGVHAEVNTVGGPVVIGEILAIGDGAYVMLAAGRVVVVPWARVVSAEFPGIEVSTGRVPSSLHYDQIRYASRFPYGIPDVAMRAVLQRQAQMAPDTVHH